MSTAQAADALGISDSAVRHRLAKRTLWSFALRCERRLPFWQFVQPPDDPDGLAVLPGLHRFIGAFPVDASPSEINAAMTTPQSGLEIDDEAVTAVRWIMSGHGADAAVEVLRDMTTVW